MKRYVLALLATMVILAFVLPAQACVHGHSDGWLSSHDDNELLIHGDGKAFHFFSQDEEGAYLGVTLGEVDNETAEEAGLKQPTGALVLSVFDDTPADKAGLEAGDLILKFDGSDIEGVSELIEMVSSHEPGDKVKIRVRRDGKKKDFKVTLAERDRSFFMTFQDKNKKWRLDPLLENLKLPHFRPFYFSRGHLGVDVRDLDKDLAEYFPGSEKGGALVMAVLEDTPASEAGLKAGDVIFKLGDHEVKDVADLMGAVRTESGEDDVELHYLRKGKERKTKVELQQPEFEIKLDQFRSKLDHAGDRIYKHIRIDDENIERKLKKLERKLEELEKRLEDLD